MGGYERAQTGFSEIGPPHEVAIDSDHRLQLIPIGSHSIDIRHLPRPLGTIDNAPDEEISDQEREARDEYIAMCQSTFAAIWNETAMFIATTSLDEVAELNESAVFDTHLAYDELVQNAFRHGGRPQRLWVSLVSVSDAYPLVPRQPDDDSVQLRAAPTATASGYRVLLGVQDTSPDWHERSETATDELPENLRGLDIVRGVSKAVWYQSNEPTSKWVWTLI